MTVLYYVGFFMVSLALLMLIYNYSTYHKYFKYAGAGLIGYGILVGFLLFKFNLHQFFLWHLGLSAVFLFNNYRSQKKAKTLIELEDDKEVQMEMELSLEKTLKYHILSTITYLLSFAFSYLYFYNQWKNFE